MFSWEKSLLGGCFILVLDVCVFGVRGLRVSVRKRIWQWPESSSRTLLCSTSGTCNCSYSLSLCASPPPADRTHGTACGSFSFPTEWDFPMLHALPTLRARKPEAQVLGTIIRRILQIYELRSGDGAESVCYGRPVICAVARAHASLVHLEFLGLVVLHFKVIANLTEIRKLHPARLHCATFWHTVAPTDPLHGCRYSLEHEVGYC